MATDDKKSMYQIDTPEKSASGSDPAANDPRSQLVQLLDASADKNFVFLFGSPAAGKTAILGSVIQAMERPEVRGRIYVHGVGDGYFRHGAALWQRIRDSFAKKRFPGRTDAGHTIQLHAHYKPANGDAIDFIFLEMAGEDLKQVVITDQGGRNLPFHIDQFLRIPQMKLVFLITTSWSEATKDDVIIGDFLTYISEKAPHLIDNRIILLVTKWDTYPNAASTSVEQFVKQRMPKTFNKISDKRNIIQTYSIGSVIPFDGGEGDIIASFNYEAGQRLFSRILETFTGISSEPRSKFSWKLW